jgi:hypothetical protein
MIKVGYDNLPMIVYRADDCRESKKYSHCIQILQNNKHAKQHNACSLERLHFFS